MFIVALFTEAKRWIQPKFPRWMNEEEKSYTHMVEHYSALKMNATTWMYLEKIMSSEIRQSQKDNS
jgi:hypothetical protein